MSLFVSEERHQAGGIVVITRTPPRLRKSFAVGTKHVIQEPPKNKMNSGMSVWLLDRKGVPVALQYMYWKLTPDRRVVPTKPIEKAIRRRRLT